MQSMKVRGYRDIDSALQRARKLRALGRISGPDLEAIEKPLLTVLARIVTMEETDATGEPIVGEES
jgi:hypothetical protein